MQRATLAELLSPSSCGQTASKSAHVLVQQFCGLESFTSKKRRKVMGTSVPVSTAKLTLLVGDHTKSYQRLTLWGGAASRLSSSNIELGDILLIWGITSKKWRNSCELQSDACNFGFQRVYHEGTFEGLPTHQDGMQDVLSWARSNFASLLRPSFFISNKPRTLSTQKAQTMTFAEIQKLYTDPLLPLGVEISIKEVRVFGLVIHNSTYNYGMLSGLDVSEVAHCVVEEGSCPNSIRCSAPLTLHIGDCSFFNKGDAQLLLDKDVGYSDVLFDVSNVLIRTSNRSSGSTAQLFSTPRTKLVRSVLPPSAYACRRGAAKSTRPASKSSEMQAGTDEKDEGGVVYIIDSILDACDSKTEPYCSHQDDHCCSVKKQTGVPAIKQSEQSWTIELWAKIEAMFSASESLVVDQTTGSAENNDNNTGKYCRQSFRKLSNNKVFDRYPFQVINTDQLVKKKRNIPSSSAGDRSETESDVLGVDHTRGHGSHVNRAQKQGSTPCPSDHQNSAEYAYSDLLMALRIGERKLPQSFNQQILALAPARVIKSLFLNLPAHFCVSPSQPCCSVIKAGSLLPSSPSKRSKAEDPLLVSAKETTAGDTKEEREGSTSSLMSLLDNPSSSACDSCDVRSAIGCLLARLREGRQPWPSNRKTTWFKFRLVYQALGEFCN